MNDEIRELIYQLIKLVRQFSFLSSEIEKLEETKKEMDNFLKEIDSILFYNPDDLQRQIEEEMREDGFNDGEMKSKREIAKSLLVMGVNTIDQIAEATGLSIEEVKELQEK